MKKPYSEADIQVIQFPYGDIITDSDPDPIGEGDVEE